ncbi:MAG: DUF4430 domain-containing protein [Oscillospiraceae bacterium]|jgi:hypothetical protein|nr:DUF4430 domain-containing protein [Oscillospiraceae bacterium]
MKKYKWRIIVPVLIAAVLAFAFWYGGSAPGLSGWTVDNTAADSRADKPAAAAAEAPAAAETPYDPVPTAVPAPDETSVPTPTSMPAPDVAPEPAPTGEELPEPVVTPEPEPAAAPGADLNRPMSAEEKVELARELAGGESSSGVAPGDSDYSAEQGMQLNPETGKDRYLTAPVPEGKPVPVEPQDAIASDTAFTCTLSVRCDTILDNINWLDPEKVELVPEDGVIFPATAVTFYEGESVFNVLWREMKRAGIHFEFVNTPIYNSAYIEGINNLYEFDCGELSGWMYKVNNWFPNYGCSRYQLRDGDTVEWVFTCDLGVDVGGYYSVGG